MAEPSEPAPAAASDKPAPQQPQKDQQQQQNKKPDAKQDAPAPAGEKKLSGAELKKKAKEEKAARRAQAKAASGGAPGGAQSGPQQQQQQDAKGGKGKPKKQDGQHGQQQQQQQNLPLRPAAEQKPKETKAALPETVSHLSLTRRPDITEIDKDVQQPILMLGQFMAAFAPEVRDSTERLVMTLKALKKVINSYTTPQGTTFSRHFTSHMLSPQIDYLTSCRPMCFGMGNAIRWLKLQISKVDIDLSDFEVKKQLCNDIDTFLSTRVEVARPEIAKKTAEQLQDGDTVLTFGDHRLVKDTLLHAYKNGKTLTVIVCEDPWQPYAEDFVGKLRKAGFDPDDIWVSYTHAQHCQKLESHTKAAQRVIVLAGAEAMFTDGALYARQGTMDLARTASKLGRNFIALCETINVADRVAVDSLTLNELDPTMSSAEGARLLYDITPPKYVARVVTEMGTCPPEAMDEISGNTGEF